MSVRDGDTAEPTPASARWPRWLALVPATALVVIALWEIVATARVGADIPGADAWERAAAHVRERRQPGGQPGGQPGDLVVFAPAWIDPVGRMHLGDLISLDQATRMDAARYPVIWELAIRGARAPETRGLPASALASSTSFGGIAVRRWVREPAVVITDFAAAFPAARVSGAAASRVQVRVEEVGFAPHRCVRVEPRPDQTVRVAYTGVALGSALVGYAGLADVFTRRDVRTPGRLAVTVVDAAGGEPAATSVELGVDDGWVRFEVPTRPGTGDVVFEATAPGRGARRRLICFAAEARR